MARRQQPAGGGPGVPDLRDEIWAEAFGQGIQQGPADRVVLRGLDATGPVPGAEFFGLPVRHRVVGLHGRRSLERRAHDVGHPERQDDQRNDGDGDGGGSEQPPPTGLWALNHAAILGSPGGTVYPELSVMSGHTLSACRSFLRQS